MEGRREQKPRPENPEESPLGVEVAERRPSHDREHEHPGQVAGRHRARQRGFDDGERPLVRAPVFRIGGEAGPERGSRPGIGKMEEDQHNHARREHAHPVAADERRQRGDGRELGERREGEHGPDRPRRPWLRSRACVGRTGLAVAGRRIVAGRRMVAGNGTGVGHVRGVGGGPGPARRQGEKDQDHEQKDAEGLEMSAPGGLDHQQWRPRKQDEGPGHGAAGPAGHLNQQQTGRQVGERPQHLECQQRPAEERARREDHLGEGRVDGGDGGIVDARVPGGANGFQCRRVRRVQVGVDARQLHVPVPEVAVDVVGQKRNAGE